MKKEKIKMECYHTVYTEGTGEIVEKKSRFIAEVSLLGICNRKKSGGRENER